MRNHRPIELVGPSTAAYNGSRDFIIDKVIRTLNAAHYLDHSDRVCLLNDLVCELGAGWTWRYVAPKARPLRVGDTVRFNGDDCRGEGRVFRITEHEVFVVLTFCTVDHRLGEEVDWLQGDCLTHPDGTPISEYVQGGPDA